MAAMNAWPRQFVRLLSLVARRLADHKSRHGTLLRPNLAALHTTLIYENLLLMNNV
jgi:hypothetical protein